MATLMMTIMAGGMHAAEAKPTTRTPDNPWAQLMGENVEERNKEIDKLERECRALEGRIARLEAQVADEESVRYARDPGLRFQEKGELADARRELAQKEAAIKGLEEGMDRGLEREQARRERTANAVDGTVFEFADPLLDLSPENLASPDIAAYFKKHDIKWMDHGLYMDDKAGERMKLTVGADVTDAHFFLQDHGRDLMIVLTVTDAANHRIAFKTTMLDNGRFTSYYDSNDQGAPTSPDSD
ncbi:hypothetical protein EBS80_00985 [bacterium]|nr:hypothetical protein [bacterium]